VLTHYVAFAARQLAKSPLYGVLSIGGLALGLAACILVALFVHHETSYDRTLPDVDRLYRVHTTVNIPGRPPIHAVLSQGALQEAVERELPEVEHATRLEILEATVKRRDASAADELALVDPTFFTVLDLPVARGDRARIFADPSAVLVTETTARRYFGDADPIGSSLQLCCFADQERELRVVGVLRDLPAASHLKLSIIAELRTGMDPYLDGQRIDWMNVTSNTYVKLRPGATADQVDARLAALVKVHIPPVKVGDKLIQAADLIGLHVRAVRDLHLAAASDAGLFPDMKPAGDPGAVSTLTAVGLILLLISVTNFINMATARSGRRAREIAVRKVLGAAPRDIILQYLGEAVLIAVGALVLALALVELALPWFRDVTQRPLADPFALPVLAGLVGGSVVIGLIAGAYPALVLSRFQPASVMKASQTSVAGGSARLRKILVFSQFAAAIALVACTAVIVRQAQYAASADLGFDPRNKLVVKRIDDRRVRAVRDQLADAVRRVPLVTSAVLAERVPTTPQGSNTVIENPGDASGAPMIIAATNVDQGFFGHLGVAPLAGRSFDRAQGDEGKARNVILNLAAMHRLGYASADAAVGRVLRNHVSETETAESRIVGVVPDIHFTSARFAVEPTIFALDLGAARWLSVGFAPGAGAAVLRDVQRAWTQLVPDVPFEADYLEAMVDAQGRDDRRLGFGLAGAALLAMIVAFAGLYGLSSFITESRTREVAIRKVLGAPDRDILRRLLWQMTQPILLACLVALPLAYYLMSGWLARFAYHLALGPGVFLATGAAGLGVAVATVSAQALTAARRRPVQTLRGE
jgi:putative ABC transport system permease protein